MARDGVGVDPRVHAAVAAKCRGEVVDVAAVCREVGISRQTFYVYLRRYAAEGLTGLFERSRRPRRSPRQVPAAMEDQIVRVRKELGDAGWPNGAISVLAALRAAGVDPTSLPSRASVHRVLVRRGQVVPAPAKRPRRPARRFEAATANALWQIDGFTVTLADGTTAWVLQLVDDHSRLDLACRAATSENAADAWAAFQTAVARYGLPAAVLSDNGLAFSARRRGWVGPFEANLAALGVRAITSRVRHPQTCGKVERAHATVRGWLARHPAPGDLPGLQALLERYRAGYNTRAHQALGGLTPQQRFDAATKTGPAPGPLTRPAPITRVLARTVGPRGAVGVDDVEVGLGRRYIGLPVTVFSDGDHVTVFADGHLIRSLTIDHTRRYQPVSSSATVSAKS
jgi:transposase InsO family protein